MSTSQVLSGACCKVYLAGKVYPPCQSVNFTIDYGEDAIYGIDSVFPQEIAITRLIVQGTITGLIIKGMGGLQAYDIRPKILDILRNPYISLKITDRATDTDIITVPNIKICQEQISILAKGIVKVSFNFKGIIPMTPIDMS